MCAATAGASDHGGGGEGVPRLPLRRRSGARTMPPVGGLGGTPGRRAGYAQWTPEQRTASRARALAFLPVIRDVFGDAAPTVKGRERVMQQLNRGVHEHLRYQRLPQRAQIFLAGYIHRCFEEVFGPGDEAE